MVPWAYASLQPKRHLRDVTDRQDRQTGKTGQDRQTDNGPIA